MTRPALSDLVALARAAGDEIMAVRQAGFEAGKKLDGSPVTIADQRAEAIIEASLAHLAPGVPMIGEESIEAGRIPDPGDVFWCVDPLDATNEFVRGGDEFTVNIALVENGTPVMGVVYAPALGEMFAGEPGRALKNDAAITPGAPGERWRLIASRRSGSNDATQAFASALESGAIVRAASSLKFCRLAEGAADLYPRFGPMSEWDVAAGHAVLSAVGGGVMDLSGAPLKYGKRESAFVVSGLIAYATEAAREAGLKALKAPSP